MQECHISGNPLSSLYRVPSFLECSTRSPRDLPKARGTTTVEPTAFRGFLQITWPGELMSSSRISRLVSSPTLLWWLVPYSGKVAEWKALIPSAHKIRKKEKVHHMAKNLTWNWILLQAGDAYGQGVKLRFWQSWHQNWVLLRQINTAWAKIWSLISLPYLLDWSTPFSSFDFEAKLISKTQFGCHDYQ